MIIDPNANYIKKWGLILVVIRTTIVQLHANKDSTLGKIEETIIETFIISQHVSFTIFPDPSNSENSGTPIRFSAEGIYSSIPCIEAGRAWYSLGIFIVLSNSEVPCLCSCLITKCECWSIQFSDAISDIPFTGEYTFYCNLSIYLIEYDYIWSIIVCLDIIWCKQSCWSCNFTNHF